MKLIKPLTCALALAMSGMAFADVTVSVPDDVSVLAANGETKLSGGFLLLKNIDATGWRKPSRFPLRTLLQPR